MKKIFWTTVFWLVVFFGFGLYIKMFDANMAVGISTWLGATTVTTSGQAISSTTTGTDTMGEFAAIQTRLIDMQTKLDALIAGSTITPVVTPDTTVVAPSKVTGTGN